MADGATTNALAEILPPIGYAIAAAVAGGVSGALRHGSRITALESKAASFDAAKAEVDKVREELKQYKAEALAAPRQQSFSGATLPDDVLRRLVAEQMAGPLVEIRAVSREMDQMRANISADAREADSRWRDFDRLVGRFGRALEIIDGNTKG